MYFLDDKIKTKDEKNANFQNYPTSKVGHISTV